MSDKVNLDNMPDRAIVQFNCHGTAVGKMRNELYIEMVKPFKETFKMATDEGAFHGGDATAEPPLALFIGGLTGCLMTQIRAFAKRLKVPLNDLQVDTQIEWDWAMKGRTYETAPKSFKIDVLIDSDAPIEKQLELVEAAKKGCFIEQTLGQKNLIQHRLKTTTGWVDA